MTVYGLYGWDENEAQSWLIDLFLYEVKALHFKDLLNDAEDDSYSYYTKPHRVFQ